MHVGQMPFCHPNNSVKSLKETQSTSRPHSFFINEKETALLGLLMLALSDVSSYSKN